MLTSIKGERRLNIKAYRLIYPINYEEIRESNPTKFLLSGILAASFVNATSYSFLALEGDFQNHSAELPAWEVMAKKRLSAAQRSTAKAGDN